MRHERRKAGYRIYVDQGATLTNSDGQALTVRVNNLSRDGFSIDHPGEDLTAGEIVTIQSERGTVATGEIRWVTSAEAGGVFIDLPDELE